MKSFTNAPIATVLLKRKIEIPVSSEPLIYCIKETLVI